MSNAPSILALDAAGGACSVALWHDGALCGARCETMTRGHSERLLPMVGEVMAAAALDYGALDLVAVTCGPGGFTGVRIGLAAAKGLAFASGCALLGLSSFAAHALAVPQEERQGKTLCVVLESKRRDLFGQVLSAANQPAGAALVAPPEALLAAMQPFGPVLLAGDAAEKCFHAAPVALRPRLSLASSGPQVDAGAVARHLAATGWPDPPPPARPIYLRAPDVTLPGPAVRR